MEGSWHDRYVLVLLAVTAAAVVAAVVVVASGRGGELVWFTPAGAALDLPADRSLDAADLLGLRLPRRPSGYRTTDVDELLHWVGYALAERDARIAVLEQRLAEAREQERRRARQARTEAENVEETW